METINIQPVPGQSFTITLDEVRYDIAIKAIVDGVMSYDLAIDEEPVIQGFRVTPGELLIPYRHLERGGNFALYVPEGDEVDYGQLGQNITLNYLNATDLAGLRNGN